MLTGHAGQRPARPWPRRLVVDTSIASHASNAPTVGDALVALVAFGAATWLSASAFAQCDLLRAHPGELAGSSYGYALDGAGDVNGDGHADLVVGAYSMSGSATFAGRAYIHSGLDGSLLRIHDGEGRTNYFGVSVAGLGDVNGDGFDDVAVGASWWPTFMKVGRAYVYSGFDGALLYTFTGERVFDFFGSEVAAVGDVNADGFADIGVGAYLAGDGEGKHPGKVYIYSGVDGSRLHLWEGNHDSFVAPHFGYAIEAAGDLDRDGHGDVAVGEPGAFISGLGEDSGRVTIFSGLTGEALLVIPATHFFERRGEAIAGVGDVSGDDVPDLLVGAPYRDVGSNFYVGAVELISGADGSLLRSWNGTTARQFFGTSLDAADDVDFDGRLDYLVGSPFVNDATGRADVLSGADGSTICTLRGDAVQDFFGYGLTGLGDADGDGDGDFALGAWGSDEAGFQFGAVNVYAGACGDFALVAPEPWHPGERARIDVACGPADADVYVAYSLRGEGSTFIPQLNVTLDLDRPQLAGRVHTDAFGRGSLSLPIPDGTSDVFAWFQGAVVERKTEVLLKQIE